MMHATADDSHLPIGERVLECDPHAESTDPTEPLRYLAVLVETAESRALTIAMGFDTVQSHLEQPTPPTDIGLLARWQDLYTHELLEQRTDPTALGAGVKHHQIPVTARPLSQLRSVEGTLIAAEERGMVYNEALKPLLDPTSTPPILQELADKLSVSGHHVRYDPTTGTLRVSQSGRTCAVFTDGSVVGEETLCEAIRERINRLEGPWLRS